MKKSALAFAALSLVSGIASAQSSVTVFGIMDVAVRNLKGVDDLKLVTNEGRSTSRLGFKGVEDLGGGMKAAFWLESGLNADDGSTDSSFWQRRATVSLMGSFGEVRLGRAKWSNRLVQDDFDVFGNGGMPGLDRLFAALPTTKAGTTGTLGPQNRADNQVAYLSPSFGGFYFNAEAAAGEGADSNKGVAGRIGYKAGALHVSGAHGQHGGSTSAKFKSSAAGISYDFGMLQLNGLIIQNKRDQSKQTIMNAGVIVPVGQGKLIASYGRSNGNNTTAFGAVIKERNDASIFGLGYDYAISKRTTLYTTVARVNNDGAAAFSLRGSKGAATPRVATGTIDAGNSTGYDVGIRHTF